MDELGKEAIKHAYHKAMEWLIEQVGGESHLPAKPMQSVMEIEGRSIPFILYEREDGTAEKIIFVIDDLPAIIDRPEEKQSGVIFRHLRVLARLPNQGGFKFTVYRAGLLSGLGKLFRMQDIEVGHKEFDEAFIVKSNNVEKARALFADENIRQLLQSLPQLTFDLEDDILSLFIESRFVDKIGENNFSHLFLFERTNNLLNPKPATVKEPEQPVKQSTAKPAKKAAAKKRAPAASKAKSPAKRGTKKSAPAKSSAKKSAKKR